MRFTIYDLRFTRRVFSLAPTGGEGRVEGGFFTVALLLLPSLLVWGDESTGTPVLKQTILP